MGTHRPEALVRPFARRAATVGIVGALPLSVAIFCAVPAVAAPPQQTSPPTLAVDLSVPEQDPAPIADSARIRIGDIQVDRPEWITPEQGTQLNDAAAGSEAALTQSLEAAGVEPARSARISEDVLGTAAVGAVVGGVAASPIAVTGAVVGVVAGLVAGLPFAPAGLVVVPVIGAVLGYAMVAAPFMALGAAVGAAAGAVDGALAPLPVADDQPSPAQ